MWLFDPSSPWIAILTFDFTLYPAFKIFPPTSVQNKTLSNAPFGNLILTPRTL
jgi:hypothetical protein